MNEAQNKIERDILTRQHADPDFLLCRHGEKDWQGADPSCAFNEEGVFREDNWNCFLLNRVRSLMGQWGEDAPGNYWWDEDQNYGVLFISSWINRQEVDSYLLGCFILMDWYKSRGSTDSFRILEGDTIRQGNEKDALEIYRLYSWFIEGENNEDC